MKKSITTFLLVCISILSVNAQTITVPDAVKNTFKTKYPTATNVKWGKDNAKEYEAEFKLNNNAVSANFKLDGSWVETESVIPAADLPAAVKAVVTTKHPGAVITLAERVDAPGKVLYEVSFKVNGKKKSMEMKPDGTQVE